MVANSIEPWGSRAEHRSWRDAPGELDRPLDAVDSARELCPGEPTRDTGDHRVRDPGDAVLSREDGFEHVGAFDVAPRRVEVVDGLQLDASTGFFVEESGEDGEGVEVRQRQPVDAAIWRDEGDGAAIADGGVVAKGKSGGSLRHEGDDATGLPGRLRGSLLRVPERRRLLVSARRYRVDQAMSTLPDPPARGA